MEGNPTNIPGSEAGGIVHDTRYKYLRSHLSRLGYNAHLPPDAVDLCEAVFLDLVDLTRRFRDVKLDNDKKAHEMQKMDAMAKNLRQENSQLIEKINKIYQKEMESKNDDLSGGRLDEQSEIQNFKHRISQLTARLKESETRNDRLKKQLDIVYKNKGVFVSQGQPMDRSKPVPRGQSIEQSGNPGPAEPFPALKMDSEETSSELADLRHQLDNLSLRCTEHQAQDEEKEKELQSLRKEIKERDSEIQRLNELCHSDESFEKLNRKLADKSNQETNEFLNKKVDYLNMELGKAEEELKKSVQKDSIITQLTEEKKEIEIKLSTSLKEIDFLRDEVDNIQLLHGKLKETVSKNHTSREDSNVPLSRKTRDNSEKKIKTLEQQALALKEENEELSKVYQNYQKDRKNLTEVLQQRDADISRYRNEIKNLKEDVERLSIELARSESSKISALHKASACEEDIVFHQKNVNDLTAKQKDTKAMIGRLQRELSDSKAAAKEYLDNNQTLQRKLQMMESDYNSVQEELSTLQGKEYDVTRSKGMLEKKKDALLQRIHDAEIHMDSLRKALSKKSEEQERDNERADHLQAEVNNLKEQVTKVEEQKSKLEADNYHLKSEKGILQDRFEELSRELNCEKKEKVRLERKLSNCNDHLSRIKLLEQDKHVLEMKDCQSSEEILSLRNTLARKEEESRARESALNKLNNQEIVLSRLIKEKDREINELTENLHLRKTQHTSYQQQTKELQTEMLDKEKKLNECIIRKEQLTRDLKKRDLDVNDLTQKLRLTERKFEDQKEISVNCEYSLNKLEEDIKRGRDEFERSQGCIRNMEREMENKNKELTKIKNEKHNTDLRIAELSRDLIQIENELEKKTQLVQKQQSMIAKIDGAIGISNEEIVRCRRQITELSSQLDNREEIITTLKTEYKEIHEQFSSKGAIVNDLEKAINDKEACMRDAEAQRVELTEKVKQLDKAREDIAEELKLWKEGHRKEAEYNLLWQESYEKLKSQFTEISVENVEKTQENDALQIHFSQLQTELRELQEDYEKLQVVKHKEDAQYAELRRKYEKQSNDLLVSKETQRIACEKEKSLGDEVRQRNRELEALKNRSGAENAELVTLRAEVENLHRVATHKDCRITKLEEELGNFMTHNQKLKREGAHESRYVLDLKTMLALEKEKVSKLTADIRYLEVNNSEYIQEKKDTDSHVHALAAQMEQLNDQLSHKEAAFVNLKSKLEKEQKKCEDYVDQVTRAQLEKSTLKNKIELLNQDLEVERVKFGDLQNSHKRLKQQVEIIQRYRPLN